MHVYKITLTVSRVWEAKRQRCVSGIGKDAVFEEESLGWFVAFEGSFEALGFGVEKPAWEVGDKIETTFKRLNG